VMLVLTLNTDAKAPSNTLTVKVTVGRFSAASCPVTEDERCYGAVVTNTGDAQTNVDCRLIGAGGPTAAFFNGSTHYVSGGTLLPDSSITLLIKLQPSLDASPALPQLECKPI
jgi:hypothetical protein